MKVAARVRRNDHSAGVPRPKCQLDPRTRKQRVRYLPTFSLSRSGLGSSVASASAPMVSIMRLTHSSCSTFSGMRPPTTAPTNATTSATKLTVSWNCRNLRIELNTERPHSTDLAIGLRGEEEAMRCGCKGVQAGLEVLNHEDGRVVARAAAHDRQSVTWTRLSDSVDEAGVSAVQSVFVVGGVCRRCGWIQTPNGPTWRLGLQRLRAWAQPCNEQWRRACRGQAWLASPSPRLSNTLGPSLDNGAKVVIHDHNVRRLLGHL